MKIIIIRQYHKIIFFVCALLVLSLAEQSYKKVIHNTDQKAKCIDGSSPAVYIHQGTEKDKFFIFMNGGGICKGFSLSQVLESCYQRSKTNLGSSKDLPDQLKIGGIFSTESQKSKFASWTKIFIQYCDGSMHQGLNQNPIKYKDAYLYLRGAANTRSHFQWLLTNYNFSKASKVILSGSSAGAVAAFAWTNYVRDLLEDKNALYTVVDSGVFLNYPSAQTDLPNQILVLQNLMKISNTDEKTPISICNNFYIGQQQKCLMLQYAFTSIAGKLLLIQSQYDSQAIKMIFTSANCPSKGENGMTLVNCTKSQLSNIENYRKQYLNFLNLFLQMKRFSAWSISCSNHVYTPYDAFYNVQTQKVPEKTGQTVRNVVQRYVLNNERPSVVDSVPWPQNKACAN